MSSWVLCINIEDQEDRSIIVQVTEKEGGHDLDLNLLATDDISVFRAKVRAKDLRKLQEEKYEGNDADFASIVRYCLHVNKAGIELPSSVRGKLEMGCILQDAGTDLSIFFGTRVTNITHKLGSIQFKRDKKPSDIFMFPWVVAAVKQRDHATRVEANLGEALQQSKQQIAELQKQIESLTQSKAEHETQLLQKFTLLLNEKKLRIRSQQRQLAGAETSAAGEFFKMGMGKHYRNKRKERQTDASAEESDAFESMEVDKTSPDHAGSDVEQGISTPSRSLSETPPHEAMRSDTHLHVRVPSEQSDKVELKAKGSSYRTDLSTKKTADAVASESDEDTASEDDEL